MLQILGLGAPLVEFGARYVVWLYMPAILCLLISISFFKDSCRTLVSRIDLPFQDRFRMARYQAGQAMIGLIISPLVFFSIFYRKELFQWVAGLL